MDECAGCRLALEDVREDAPREPCPQCGDTRRVFLLSGTVEARSEARAALSVVSREARKLQSLKFFLSSQLVAAEQLLGSASAEDDDGSLAIVSSKSLATLRGFTKRAREELDHH